MSQSITTAFVQQYKANVSIQYQQKGSKLRGSIREESLVGKLHYFDKLNATAALKRTTRHGDMPIVEQTHKRRMVVPTDYEWADLIDTPDKLKMLIDPQSSYVINGGNALGRAFDSEIIAAFDGTAYEGETGGTSVTFSSEAAGDVDLSAAAVTTQNILNIARKLNDKIVDNTQRTIVHSPALLEQLLKQTTLPNASSSDFNSVKALIAGEINTWVGFRWVMVDPALLTSPAANMRYCYAYHYDSMGIAVAQEITTDISQRKDKSGLPNQVYISCSMGATRIWGEGVVRIKIDETK